MTFIDANFLCKEKLLDKTIAICIKELRKTIQTISYFSKQQILGTPLLNTEKENILFDQ